MPNTAANRWYDTFAKKHFRDDMGIDLIRPRDARRLLVPDENGNGMRPLFPNGFQGKDEQKEELFKHAQLGELFAISKKDDKAYQFASDRVQSVDDTVEQDNKRISIGRRIAYTASKAVTGPVGLGFRVGKNLLNIATLGLLSAPLNWAYDKLASAGDLLIEGIFSVKQMKEENSQRLTIGDRFANALSFGKARAEKVNEVHNNDRLTEACIRAKEHLGKSILDIAAEDRKAEEERKANQETQERARKLKETQDRLKAFKSRNNPEAQQDPLAQQNQPVHPDLDSILKFDDDVVEAEEQVAHPENELHNEEAHPENNILNDENNQINADNVNEHEQNQIQNQAQNHIPNQNQNQNNDKPAEKTGKEIKTELIQMYEELINAFGAPGGFEKAVMTAQNMNQLIVNLKENQHLRAESGMKDQQLERLSNICNNFISIYEKGMEANIDLMQPDNSRNLTEQEKATRVTNMLVMHMCENAMVNAALSAKKLGNDAKMKPENMLKSMMQNPEDFQRNLSSSISAMNTARTFAQKSPEELAKSVENPQVMRNALIEEVRQMAQNARIARENQRQQEIQRQQQIQQQQQQIQQQQQPPQQQPPQPPQQQPPQPQLQNNEPLPMAQ